MNLREFGSDYVLTGKEMECCNLFIHPCAYSVFQVQTDSDPLQGSLPRARCRLVSHSEFQSSRLKQTLTLYTGSKDYVCTTPTYL